MWRVRALLELGDLPAAAEELEVIQRGVEDGQAPLSRWFVPLWASLRATLEGRLVDGERLAQEALTVGSATRGPAGVAAIFGAQLFVLRFLQGRLAEIAPAVEGYVEQAPTRPEWRAALALALTEVDDPARARAEVRAVVDAGLDRLPSDVGRPVAYTLLAFACGRIAERAAAAELYGLLLPYADLCCVVGVTPSVCAGSFSYPLGVLAATIGRVDEAEEHFSVALERNRRLGARPWVALVEMDYGRLLAGRGERGRASNLFNAARTAAVDLGMSRLAATSDG